MKPTQPTGSPARTGVRLSLIRDPGAKNFQKFGKDGTKNEKEPKKKKQWPVENDAYGNPQNTCIPTSSGLWENVVKPQAFPRHEQDYGTIQTRIVDFRRSKLRS